MYVTGPQQLKQLLVCYLLHSIVVTGMESGCGDLISYPVTTWYRPPLIQLTVQGHSNRYGWSGFNWTTFWGNNHISANILEFGSVPHTGWQPHGHSWQSRDRWLQIVWKWCFLVFKARRCHESPSWQKNFPCISTSAASPPYCNRTTSNLMVTALLSHVALHYGCNPTKWYCSGIWLPDAMWPRLYTMWLLP